MREYLRPYCISVDPGYRRGAYAIWTTGTSTPALYRYDHSDKDMDPIGRLTYLVQSILQPSSFRTALVIENQVFSAPDPRGLIKLVEARMVWEQAARYCGFEVYSISPDVWQSSVAGVPRGTKRESCIRSYKAYAQTLLKKELTADEAAAYLIGLDFLNKDALACRMGSSYLQEYVLNPAAELTRRKGDKARKRNAEKKAGFALA